VVTIPNIPLGSRSGSFLPSRLADTVKGESKQARMRRSVLQTLADGALRGTRPPRANPEVQLVGWVSQPIGKLAVDGRSPREISETLVVVHLDR
jgi:hypothetical protein